MNQFVEKRRDDFTKSKPIHNGMLIKSKQTETVDYNKNITTDSFYIFTKMRVTQTSQANLGLGKAEPKVLLLLLLLLW